MTSFSLGYSFTGFLALTVVFSIAELSALVPLTGGIIRHADYFVDPALAFANGWNLVYAGLVGIPAEIVAASIIIDFWTTHVSNAVWITVLGLLVVVSNFCFVRLYGEIEFISACLKIMLIVGINIMALVITCGGGPSKWSLARPEVQTLLTLNRPQVYWLPVLAQSGSFRRLRPLLSKDFGTILGFLHRLLKCHLRLL